MKELRFAIIGTGFWSAFQLSGWNEVGGAKCVAVYNRTRAKAERFARDFGIPTVHGDPETMLEKENLDFVDIITDVDTHSPFVHLAAEKGLPIVCQKPLAPSLEIAEKMLRTCREKGVPLLVNENFRWQTPIRQFHSVLKSGVLGRIFRARVQFANSFPVFDNQPFLKELDQFILTDIGTHILDVARFLFGEVRTLYCRIDRVNPEIKGEDVATVVLGLDSGTTVICEMSYATRMEKERFPETFVFAEGEKGSAELGPDYWIRVTTEEGTRSNRYPPPRYDWADPAYDVVHASIVPCQENLLSGLRGIGSAET
ncbi:MAG TPA: Gfo/Idh/MocA family oxidoreductase, partial [Acidobacteriota bacterium]|nr:Gfo/Idh/MocA family oxidoreductase [Acidobacteriota bacterium]